MLLFALFTSGMTVRKKEEQTLRLPPLWCGALRRQGKQVRILVKATKIYTRREACATAVFAVLCRQQSTLLSLTYLVLRRLTFFTVVALRRKDLPALAALLGRE